MKVRLISLVLSGCFISSLPAAEPPVKRTPSGIVISKETTFLTEPLDADGCVDYLGYLDRKASEGVTAENNVVALLAQALGPEMFYESHRKEMFRGLGIPVPPVEGNYFVSLFDIEREFPDDVREDAFTEGDTRPWSAEEFPSLARWMKRNEEPMKIVMKALQRPRHYLPQFSERTARTHQGEVYPNGYRSIYSDICWFLRVRVMWSLHKGESERAMEDLLALRQITRYLQNSVSNIDSLSGMIYESLLISAEWEFLYYGKLSAEQIRNYIARVATLTPIDSIPEYLAGNGRLLKLDQIQALSREDNGLLHQIRLINALEEPSAPQGLTPMSNLWKLAHVDHGMMMRQFNDFYDQRRAILQLPTLDAQDAAAESLTNICNAPSHDLNAFKLMDGLGKKLVFSSKSIPETITERVGPAMIGKMVYYDFLDVGYVHQIHQKRKMQQVVYALSLYQAEHQTWPKTLSEMIPKYIQEVPTDFYNGKPVTYRRTKDGYLMYSVFENRKDDHGKPYITTSDGDLVMSMPPVPYYRNK